MTRERQNPIYFLLLVAGLAFVLTAVAIAVIPVLEEKAIESGNPPPPSEWRDALRERGWVWLLYELAAVVILAFASMAWDWRRGLQNKPDSTTISDEKSPTQP